MGKPYVVALPKKAGAYGPEDELERMDCKTAEDCKEALTKNIESFKKAGGIVNLILSAVFTKGADAVRKDISTRGGELPLVYMQHSGWLCSSELMSLLLRGFADTNVGAFKADGKPNDWDKSLAGKPLGLGLLSKVELDTGVEVANSLKSPEHPVWILHGGDHFTLAWSQAAPEDKKDAKIKLWHWNGLPPGGPRLADLEITAPEGQAKPAGKKSKAVFYKPEVGEIDDIVQPDEGDKKENPDDYTSWTYECMLAFDDPTVEGKKREVPEPTFKQDDERYQRKGAWRCARCYATRFQTMHFKLVPASSPDECDNCKRKRADAGWSLWIPYKDLPLLKKKQLMKRYAKKIENVLRTKWPAAEIKMLNDEAKKGLPST